MSVAAALSQTNGILSSAALASSASALEESAPPSTAQTLFSCTSFCMFCVAPCGLGSSSHTSSAGWPMIMLLRCSSASIEPFARYSVCPAIWPVLASSRPIFSGSAARATYGAARGTTARPAAPSSALRRGNTILSTVMVFLPRRSLLPAILHAIRPFQNHPVTIQGAILGQRKSGLNEDGRRAGLIAALTDDAADLAGLDLLAAHAQRARRVEMLLQDALGAGRDRIEDTLAIGRLQLDRAFLAIGQGEHEIDLEIVDGLARRILHGQVRHAGAVDDIVGRAADIDAAGSRCNR